MGESMTAQRWCMQRWAVGRKGSTMDPRIMNRRTLCKTLAAVALAGLFEPLTQPAAAEPVMKPASEAHRDRGVRKAEQKFFMCILRRQHSGECVTFWREPGGIKGRRDDGIKLPHTRIRLAVDQL